MPPHNLSQLVREDNVVKNQTYVYTYDNAGNITSKKTYSLTAASSEPSGTPTTTTYGYSTGDWGDLLTSFNGSSITYDAIGNPLTYYGSRSFTWEGRRLVGATVSSKSLSFKYNDEGLRTSKMVNGVTTNYYYNGSQLIAEETNGNITLYMYNSTGIVGFRYRTSSYAKGVWDTYLYEKNMQGDIVAVYDGNGTKKISYTYDAWGNFTATYHNGASATNLFNPYTYRGYYYDKDLSLYYLSSRYYDSNTGRFINADGLLSTGQGLLGYNMFAYCNNNPVMHIDPTGESLLGFITIATITYTCYAFVVNSLISDVPKDAEKSDALHHFEKADADALYYDVSVNESYEITTKVAAEAGVYTENIEINEYNSINTDVCKASGSIGYGGASAGLYLGEVTFKNEALKVGKQTFSFSIYFNCGIGGSLNFGEEFHLGASFILGGGVIIEVYEE